MAQFEARYSKSAGRRTSHFAVVRSYGRSIGISVVAVAALLFPSQESLAQWSQQGPKLVGTAATGAGQGSSISLSSNGGTAIVGGPSDNSSAGAVWVFTRSATGVWTQQGPKLIGTGAIGAARQGTSVSLSSDGSTAFVGGPGDNGGIGAVWVFTRSATGVWTQQGPKLIGTGAIGTSLQGASVSLSSNGDTAIVGGPADGDLGDGTSTATGAAWIYTRSSGGVWTQQGLKLVGTGGIGSANQGISVSLSFDGSTAIIGGRGDNANTGAAWVFSSGASGWTQQGGKLVGMGATGAALQGASVSLSIDGSIAILGGPGDNGSTGAAWAFTRTGGVWTQHPGKLVGIGAIGTARQGTSVSLSSDGNTAIVGGPFDNVGVGAVWVFTRGSGLWTQQGVKLAGTGAIGAAQLGGSASLSSDARTIATGGIWDNLTGYSAAGAAWVFVAATPPAPTPTYAACTWAERTFSHGAKFCMGPTAALTCDNGRWTAATYAPCNTAPAIDAK